MRRALLAALGDVLAVVIFVGIGRSAHGHVDDIAGLASTSWPFLVGAAAGWGVGRVWRRPLALLPAGVSVVVGCVALGMVLRVIAGQGTAAAFIGVALSFLGLEMLGWRLVTRFALRRRTPAARGAR